MNSLPTVKSNAVFDSEKEKGRSSDEIDEEPDKDSGPL